MSGSNAVEIQDRPQQPRVGCRKIENNERVDVRAMQNCTSLEARFSDGSLTSLQPNEGDNSKDEQVPRHALVPHA